MARTTPTHRALTVLALLITTLAVVPVAERPAAAAPVPLRPAVGAQGEIGGLGRDEVRAAAPTPDGGFVAYAFPGPGALAGPSPGGMAIGAAGDRRVAVVRFAADGTPVWTVVVRSAGVLDGWDLDVTDGGDVVAAVVLTGSATIDGPGFTTQVSSVGTDGLVLRLAPDGSLRWTWSLSGPGLDQLTGVAAAPDDEVVLTGSFGPGASLGPPDDPLALDGSGVNNLVVARVAADGAVRWVATGGSGRGAYGRGVVVGSDGSVVVAGVVEGSLTLGAPGAPGAPVTLVGLPWTGFVLALDPTGAVRWLVPSGLGVSLAWDVALGAGPTGPEVIVGGAFAGPWLPPGAGTPVLAPDLDGFVLALDAGTGAPVWSSTLDGVGSGGVAAVAVDQDGGVWAGGVAANETRLVTAAGTTVIPADGSNGVVLAYDEAGGLRWAHQVAGPGVDAVYDLDAVDGGLLVAATVGPQVDLGGGRPGPSRGGLDGVVAHYDLLPDGIPVLPDASARTRTGVTTVVATPADDPDGDPVTQRIAGPPAHGEVSGSAGSWRYSPAPGFEGVDQFTVEASDAYGGVAVATVTVEVTDANLPPTAPGSTVRAVLGRSTPVVLTGSDPDGDALSFQVLDPPSVGSLTGTPPALVFEPGAGGGPGSTTFTYQVDDGRGGSAVGIIQVDLVLPGPAAPPVAGVVNRSVAPGGTSTFELAGSDPDGDALTFSLGDTSGLAGTLEGAGSTWTYHAPVGEGIVEHIPYVVDDGHGGSAAGLVVLAVRPPNVVVIMTDDQTLEQQRFLTRTNELIGGAGTTFSDFVVSYSECCPSRSTLLTGQYAHNHGVRSSSPPTGGVTKLDASETLPVWLQRRGYRTALSGKYLNGYGVLVDPTSVPPGWDDWYALVDPDGYDFYGYTISDDGVLEQRGARAEDYSTDVLARHAEGLIDAQRGAAEPLFVLFTPTAPHVAAGGMPPFPAPRHTGALPTETLPRSPAFDEADVSDKPGMIAARPPIDAATATALDVSYRAQARSLLAVDDAVASMVASLEAAGELDNTVILFTSDNGFEQGEHRVAFGKSMPYEESVRVPLLARGPGFPAGAVVDTPTVNTDLAPTILAVAGAAPGRVQDGRSLLETAATPAPGRKVLLENGPLFNRVRYWGVRTERWVYLEYSNGSRELYDLSVDPYQLDNRANKLGYLATQFALKVQLNQLRTCAGPSCLIGAP